MGDKNNRVGEIGYNNQGEKIIIIRYGDYEDIDVQFEDGVIVYHRSYNNFKNGRMKHPIRYEESFAYHIEVELGIDLDDIWNWEKNNKNEIDPYKITRRSGKKVWLYCLEKDYHNYDREGNKIGYQIICSNFCGNKSRCSFCASKKIHHKDSLAYNYPQIAKMIAIEENNLTFEDCYSIACKSDKRFYFKCNKCGNISNKRKRLADVIEYGFSCSICSDGISIPNKFIANIFKQLNIDFMTELNKSDFEWCGYFRYDFYLPKYNMIIEINGLQHYKNKSKNSSWDNLEQIQWNDLFKYKCAKNHIAKYIIIDCRYSTLEWLKENIIKELSDYFNLSDINWELAWEESQNSKVIECWNYYKNGLTIKDITKMIGVREVTVYSYIRKYKSLFD